MQRPSIQVPRETQLSRGTNRPRRFVTHVRAMRVFASRAPLSPVVDETHVYWSSSLEGAIMRAPKDGSAAPSIVTTAQASVIAVAGEYVYIPHGPNIDRALKSGGTPATYVSIAMTTPPPDAFLRPLRTSDACAGDRRRTRILR
jgi:hypothetical protein